MAGDKKKSNKFSFKEDVIKPWVKGAKAGVQDAALMAVGGKVGSVAGKAVARAVAKEASPKVLKAANAAKGSGKMTYPKTATGKVTRTAAKRDVVVKTQDRTLKQNGFINRSGEKSIKVNTKNPKVRTVEKEVTKKQADRITAGTNKLRYGSAKQEAARTRAAVSDSKLLQKTGKAVGAGAATTPAIAREASKKKKK